MENIQLGCVCVWGGGGGGEGWGMGDNGHFVCVLWNADAGEAAASLPLEDMLMAG